MSPASKSIGVGVEPPWTFLGDDVTFDHIDEYVAKVSRQPVE